MSEKVKIQAVRFILSREFLERLLEMPMGSQIKDISLDWNEEFITVLAVDPNLPEIEVSVVEEVPIVNPTIHRVYWDWNIKNDDQ